MKLVSTGKTIASPEFYEKRKKARRTRNIILSILLLLLVTGLVYSTYLKSLRISEVQVVGNKVISSEDVRQTAQVILSQKYGKLIPKDNALIFPKKALMKKLTATYPRFSSIEFSQPSLKTLEVSVSERSPYALYCGAATNTDETNVCYFLDEQGYIFDRAPSFSSGVYFVYALEKPLEKPVGQNFLTPEIFASLKDFVESTHSLGLTPLALSLDAEHYKLYLKNGGVMQWKRSDDLSLIYSNLESFLNEKSIKADKTFLSEVAELDFSTPNKVFYKLKPSDEPTK